MPKYEKLKWEVWSEGYICTGHRSNATFHGTFEGRTFKCAVRNFRDSIKNPYDRSLVNVERLSFWGCRFFDNEKDARRSYG